MGILLCVKLDIHVLYLQGKERDAEAFIKDSIRMLEEGGERESFVCIRRLQYLSQIYMNSQQFVEAELVQRKILHVVELSKSSKFKVRLSFSNSGSPVFHMPPPCSVVIQAHETWQEDHWPYKAR
ncbi:hypothetical protein GLYMA_08G281500v4 [Glycine max]|uniref:uncharacterized protein isoform X2 n=1 Tax=Glycine max TaxID=3847 RepID=UPI0007191A39|nr:uncharacterized protein LOC102665150 isoform X2 [Glycine max]KAG4399676.1 hypothetical protein GLYMA_08G281500v4 [Glycine max]KAG4399688.1 hypothetical protein GLYMA_08G281500v4 [Glycine max]KAG4399694.1 hypothetical protein GLYMA_08G281500v4 [Glycine max]KAH1053467.1 hypothetical protein GYH30_022658 [Glycine max]KAH1053478.1 hypothetical protein GYH30_022658 [Glycine max]|eukprot:XP_014634794.1 uncharacterized protein LOC102665150 isoform X2 [Glycine max]